MLEFLRRQSQSWLTWLAMGVITIVFVFFFGPQAGGLQSGSKSWAVRIDRTPIYDSQLESALGRVQALGQSYSDEERYALKREIAYDIGLVHILSEEAAKAGLTITDDELHCYIVNWNRGYRLDGDFICRAFPRTYTALYPNIDFSFYSDREGNFSSTYSQDVRRWFGSSVENYEDFKRKELLALRYLEILSAGVPVAAAELEARWRGRHDTIDLEVAVFDPTASHLLEVSDDALSAYLETSEEAVRAYYDANEDQFSVERSLHLRRIYIRKPENDAELEATTARVQELVAQAQEEGADFEALAGEHNEIEREAENGGDMGVRDASTLSEEFLRAADTLEEGGVGLVEQAYAWSIIQVVQDTPAGAPAFETIREDVARALIAEERQVELQTTMRDLAEQLFASAKENPEETLQNLINDIEGSEDASFSTTGPIGLEPTPPDVSGIDPQLLPFIQLTMRQVGEIPNVGVSTELTGKAFQLSEEEPLLDEIFELDGKLVVLRLKEKNLADEVSGRELDQIRAEIIRERADALVGFSVAQRRLLLHSGEPLPPLLAETLEEHSIHFQEKLFQVPVRDADW